MPARGGAARDLRPRHREIRHEHTPGHAVDGEVVDDDEDAVALRVDLSAAEADEADDLTRARVEGGGRGPRLLGDLGQELLGPRMSDGRDLAHDVLGAHRSRRPGLDHGADGVLGGVREAHAQHVVAVDDGLHGGDHVGLRRPDRQGEQHRLREGVDVAQFQEVAHDRGRRELADPAARQLLELTLVGVAGLDDAGDLGQPGDRAAFEDVPGGEDHARGLGARDELHRHDAVAAHLEEVGVGTHVLDTEGLPHDLGDALFQRGLRRAVTGRRRHDLRVRERVAVELAVDGQRDLVEHDHGARDHVGRQRTARVDEEVGDVDGLPRLRQHVGDQSVLAGGAGSHLRGGEVDRVVRAEDVVDLAELDAEAADLDLEVGAPDVLQRAGGGPAHDVAGPVHPFTGSPERVGDEARGGQRTPAVVAAGEGGTGEVQLTGDLDRHRTQPGVEDQHAHAADRAADGDRFACGERFGHGRPDRGLGRAIEVEHGPAGRPAGDELRRAGVTRDGENPQRVQVGGLGRGEGPGVTQAWVTCSSRMKSESSSPPRRSAGATTSVEPLPNAIIISKTEASKLGDAKCSVRERGSIFMWWRCSSTRLARPRWVTTTPLGRPVEPEV